MKNRIFKILKLILGFTFLLYMIYFSNKYYYKISEFMSNSIHSFSYSIDVIDLDLYLCLSVLYLLSSVHFIFKFKFKFIVFYVIFTSLYFFVKIMFIEESSDFVARVYSFLNTIKFQCYVLLGIGSFNFILTYLNSYSQSNNENA
jgi:hypothetical protein